MNYFNTTKESKLSPFFNSKAVCPICKVLVTHRIVKSSFYSEQDLDVTHRPKRITWLKKEVGDIYPRLYYMKHCPYCHFTADDKSFEDPMEKTEFQSLKFKTKMESLLKKNPAVRKVTEYISKDVNIIRPDFQQAVSLHLLAIFFLLQFEELKKRDALSIAKYHLRLAWLYCDINENPKLKKEAMGDIKETIRVLKKFWPEIPRDEKTAFELAAKYYQVTLMKSRAISKFSDEVMLMLLICRIYLKLGDIPTAHKYLFMTKDEARRHDRRRKDYISQIAFNEKEMQRERKISFTTDERKSEADNKIAKMGVEGRRGNVLLSETTNIFEDYKEEYDAMQYDLAVSIVERIKPEKKKSLTPEQIRELLIKNNIQEKIAYKVCPDIKRKGIMKFFKK